MSAYANRYIPDNSPPLAGGHGSVVICNDPHLERKVAIKFLLAGGDRKRVFDEVKALERIRSKHVVQMYDTVVVQPGNNVGIVQEFLPGPDLTDYSKSNPTLNGYLGVLYQIALGLDDIHAQGQIHRDIKPNNVRYNEEKIIKIFDFGLARPDEDAKAQTVGFVGTRGFAAPELCNGGLVKFSQAVDVYAFAVTALWLLTGDFPVELTHPVPEPNLWVAAGGFAKVPIKLPSAIAASLNQSLAVDPAQRPPIRELRQVIEAHLVHGRHRALLTYGGRTATCDSSQKTVSVKWREEGTVVIHYDDLRFSVLSFQGSVRINNATPVVGATIPQSGVITIGAANNRLFITIDISRPEVVL